VKLGDPPEKLIALLGEPEERDSHGIDMKEQNFNYRSLGLRFDISWDRAIVPDDPKDWVKLKREDQTIDMFFVDSARISPPCRDFPGATDRGIRIGSSRKEVEAAYGKPMRENMNSADYGKLGLAVTYGPDGTTVCGFLIVKPTTEPIWPDLDELIKEKRSATTQHEPDGK
jgi:hypothetical protein